MRRPDLHAYQRGKTEFRQPTMLEASVSSVSKMKAKPCPVT